MGMPVPMRFKIGKLRLENCCVVAADYRSASEDGENQLLRSKTPPGNTKGNQCTKMSAERAENGCRVGSKTKRECTHRRSAHTAPRGTAVDPARSCGLRFFQLRPIGHRTFIGRNQSGLESHGDPGPGPRRPRLSAALFDRFHGGSKRTLLKRCWCRPA